MSKYVLIPSPDATVTFTTPSGGTGTAKSFECQVSAAAVKITLNPVTVPATGCEGPSTRQGAPSYSLDLTWLQDWGNTPDSLSQFLFDNQLEESDFTVALAADPTVPVAAGVCELVPGDYGGDFGTALTATASMSITGVPTIGPAAAGLAATRRTTEAAPAAV